MKRSPVLFLGARTGQFFADKEKDFAVMTVSMLEHLLQFSVVFLNLILRTLL